MHFGGCVCRRQAAAGVSCWRPAPRTALPPPLAAAACAVRFPTSCTCLAETLEWTLTCQVMNVLRSSCACTCQGRAIMHVCPLRSVCALTASDEIHNPCTQYACLAMSRRVAPSAAPAGLAMRRKTRATTSASPARGPTSRTQSDLCPASGASSPARCGRTCAVEDRLSYCLKVPTSDADSSDALSSSAPCVLSKCT
jgi:hypothetical protein